MERRVEGRLFVVGAKLGYVERFIIIRGKNVFTLFDRFAKRIGDIRRHRLMHDHRPAAEINGWNRRKEPCKVFTRQSCGTVAQRRESFKNLAVHRQITKTMFQCRLSPALDAFVENGVDSAALYARPPARLTGTRRLMDFAAPAAHLSERESRRLEHGRDREHSRTGAEVVRRNSPGRKPQPYFLPRDLLKSGDAGGFMHGKAHHVPRRKHRDGAKRQALAKRTLAPARHREKHRRIDPRHGIFAFGYGDDLAETTGGERDRYVFFLPSVGPNAQRQSDHA